MAKIKYANQDEQSKALRAEWAALAAAQKEVLKTELKRSYKIIDLRDADKQTLVSMIMDARYGVKKIERAFQEII